MKCKISIEGKEVEVIISGITKAHRRGFVKLATEINKLEKDDSIGDDEKANKALETMEWLENLGLEHSNLSDEQKEKLDLEATDEIVSTTREILHPQLDKKKS